MLTLVIVTFTLVILAVICYKKIYKNIQQEKERYKLRTMNEIEQYNEKYV